MELEDEVVPQVDIVIGGIGCLAEKKIAKASQYQERVPLDTIDISEHFNYTMFYNPSGWLYVDVNCRLPPSHNYI